MRGTWRSRTSEQVEEGEMQEEPGVTTWVLAHSAVTRRKTMMWARDTGR